MSTHYRIIVHGILHKQWWHRFHGWNISHEKENTVLSGEIEDPSQLQRVLSDLRNMNFTLLLVEKTEP
jgi:hypothetical protein